MIINPHTGKNIKASGALAAKLLKEHKEKKIKLSRASVKMIKHAQSGGAPSDEKTQFDELVALFQGQLDEYTKEFIESQMLGSANEKDMARLALVNKAMLQAYTKMVIGLIDNIKTAEELISFLSTNPLAEPLYNFEFLKDNELTNHLSKKLADIIDELKDVFPIVRNVTIVDELNTKTDEEIRTHHMWNTIEYPGYYDVNPTRQFKDICGYNNAYKAWEALWILTHIKYISADINFYCKPEYQRAYNEKVGIEPKELGSNSLNVLIQKLQDFPPQVKVKKSMY